MHSFNCKPQAWVDSTGRIKDRDGFVTIGPEPPGTPCEQCGRADGQVYLRRDPFRGVASHALHLGDCSAAWRKRNCNEQSAGLTPRAVDQLAREIAELGINGAAQQEAEIRQRLVSALVPADVLDVEIGNVMRRISEMAQPRGPANA